MPRSLARIMSLGFFAWNGRHMLYHVMLGLLWAWFLRELWNEFNLRWVWLSVFGSILPDLDHLVYFITYGRRDEYTLKLRLLLRSHQWRASWLYMKNGHKQNTRLVTHNVFIMMALIVISAFAVFYEWQSAVILCGAMFFHYLFDILDDLVILGRINPNWKRWGREKV